MAVVTKKVITQVLHSLHDFISYLVTSRPDRQLYKTMPLNQNQKLVVFLGR